MMKTQAFLYLLLSLLLACCEGWQAMCTFCVDGSAPTTPDRLLTVPGVLDNVAVDCATIDRVISELIPADDEKCDIAHQLSSLCGCPVPEDACNLCDDGSSVLDGRGEPTKLLPMFEYLFTPNTPSCEVMEAYLHSYNDTSDLCVYARHHAATSCGCPLLSDADTVRNPETYDEQVNNIPDVTPVDTSGFDMDLYGTLLPDGTIGLTTHQKMALAACILSICGALLVVADNYRNRTRFNKHVYNQIVVSMVIFDILFSFCASFLTIPSPTDDAFKSYGEVGNSSTCKAQGWALQFAGLTSWFLNASLSTYYVLIIVYGLKSCRLKQLRKYLIGIPIVLGLIFAFASIPYIVPVFVTCHLNPPTELLSPKLAESLGVSTGWAPFLALFIIPGYLTITYCTIALVWVFWYVRTLDNKVSKRARLDSTSSTDTRINANSDVSDRTSFSSSCGSVGGNRIVKSLSPKKLQFDVFWQSFWYLSALYFSWFFYLAVAVNLDAQFGHMEFFRCAIFLVHFNGFLNCLIYFRPRLTQMVAAKFRELRKKKICQRRPADDVDLPSSDAAEGRELIDPEAELVTLNEGEPTTEDEESFPDVSVDDTPKRTPPKLGLPSIKEDEEMYSE